MRILTSTARLLIRGYKVIISPWLPAACRFEPTCSDFASEALQKYGLLRGTVLTLSRLLRCHPLHRGGYDPLS